MKELRGNLALLQVIAVLQQSFYWNNDMYTHAVTVRVQQSCK